jgi:17beta-estradiol 17-dehydrogenase / very-long-chain 3-oxoacyl-CoA reductase
VKPATAAAWFAMGYFVPTFVGLGRYAWYQTRRLLNGSSLTQYGAGDGVSWAVVTGASSGIGAVFAEELAGKGFNVLLVARRKDMLNEVVSNILKGNPRVKQSQLRILSFDLSRPWETHKDFLARLDPLTDGSKVTFVVHMAGNSDLAVHFTDKTLDRNVELMRLNVESTLVLCQLFADIMIKNKSRGAVITSGAISAYAALPGFACSTSNKHYIRGLTRTIASEYRGTGVDFMCAHPIAVASEIVKNPNLFAIISAKSFVRGCLKDVGVSDESNGAMLHDFFVHALEECSPSLIQLLFKIFAPQWSSFLQRPINQASPEAKIRLPVRDGSA